jgi:hypothetical protein
MSAQKKGSPVMPTPQQEATLRQFCQLMDDIQSCRFICRAKTQNHNITVDIDPTKNHIPHYDRDEFRSFATLFRKLIGNKEPTQLFKVMKIIKPHAPADKQDSFKEITRELHREAEHPFIQIAIGVPGAEVPYTPRKICDVLFNGLVFHSDPLLQDDVARLLDYEPMVIVSFLRYACCVINIATHYAANIRHYNFFQNAA